MFNTQSKALFLALAVLTGAIACGPGPVKQGTEPQTSAEPVGSVEGSQGARAPDAQPQLPGVVGEVQTPGVVVGVQPVADTPVADATPQPVLPSPTPTPVPAAPAPVIAFSKEWVVSATGSDSNAGTAAAPFKTIARGLKEVGPGEVLKIRAGTYAENLLLDGKDGRADAKITIQGEGKPKLTGGAGTGALIQFKRQHWVVDGLDVDVMKQSRWGASFDGSVDGSVLANSELHNSVASAGVNVHTNATGATIENNKIHDFRRVADDSHGIVVQTTTRNTVIRNNDIYDVSGDSVQCLGPEGYNSNAPADGVLIENNRLYAVAGRSQENGVDIKTCWNVTIRNNRMNGFRTAPAGQGAKGDAVVIHLSAKNVLVEGNDIFDAGKGIALGGNRFGPMPAGVVIRRNTIHDLVKDSVMEGAAMRIENSDGAVVVNNSFWNLPGPGVILGHGTNGPTQNLVLKNNIIGGAPALKVGTQAPGLQSNGNLFAATAQFTLNGVGKTFVQWQQTGQDAQSVAASVSLSPTFVPGPAAIDKGLNVGLAFCGSSPDIGSVETGC